MNWVYLSVSQNFIDNNGGLNIGVPGQPFNEASSLSWVNVELGQVINAGAPWNIRFHGGLVIIHTSDSSEIVQNQTVLRDTQRSNNVGVRVGTNIQYNLVNALDLYIDGAFGLMYSALRQAGPIGGQINSVAGANHVLTGSSFPADFGMGVNYTYNTTSGDIVSRVGWVDYSVLGLGPLQNWQGLIFGTKWVGNA